MIQQFILFVIINCLSSFRCRCRFRNFCHFRCRCYFRCFCHFRCSLLRFNFRFFLRFSLWRGNFRCGFHRCLCRHKNLRILPCVAAGISIYIPCIYYSIQVLRDDLGCELIGNSFTCADCLISPHNDLIIAVGTSARKVSCVVAVYHIGTCTCGFSSISIYIIQLCRIKQCFNAYTCCRVLSVIICNLSGHLHEVAGGSTDICLEHALSDGCRYVCIGSLCLSCCVS